MVDTHRIDDAALAEHRARNSALGLLRRYARARVRAFWHRQAVALLGAVALGLLASPWLGVSTAAFAVGGDAIDCLLLAKVPKLADRGMSLRRLIWATASTAALQAVTVAVCIVITAVAIGGYEGLFFAFSLLAGALVNAGMSITYHPAAAKVRFWIFGATSFLALAMVMDQQFASTKARAAAVMSAVMLGYLIHVFIAFVRTTQLRNRKDAGEILQVGAELSRTNRELRESQAEANLLALVARHASDSIILSDPNGRVTWVNPAFTTITGFDANEIIGRTMADLLDGPDTEARVSDAIQAAISKGVPFRAEILNYRKDGKKIWMDTNLTPILSANGKVETVVSVERDITQAKCYAAELDIARLAAEDAARVKSEFLATMSHEIRTPLNAVMGLADLLCDEPLTPNGAQYARTIRESSDALLQIINDVLDLSKLEAGKLTLTTADFDAAACLSSAVGLFSALVRQKGLDLTFKTDDGFPSLVHGDEGKFRQIIVNIVGNAVKFTESGGVDVRASAEHIGAEIWLCVAVSDTGIGIDAERIEHMFEDFSQADSARNRRFGGTGLGLTISRRLARLMGGDIAATSQPGAGSTFEVRVPFAAPLNTTVETDTPRDTRLPSVPENLTVLLAEDNRANRLLLERYLAGLPIQVDFAEDGHGAVNCWREKGHDLIFMDMSMPGMDGLSATRAIRSAPGGDRPRILALTANVMESDRQNCLDAGMDGFLTKPIRRDDLLAELASRRQNAAVWRA